MAVQAYFCDTVKVNDNGWYEVVLPWIESRPPFPRNRIQEVQNLTKKDVWRHVPSAINPADLPCRAFSVRHLLDSKWWEGPSWSRLPPEDWPCGESQPDEDSSDAREEKDHCIFPFVQRR
jgi:hypothetical protein